MLFFIPIPLIIVALLMAAIFRGRWYKASLVFSFLSIVLLIYALTGNSGGSHVSLLNCHSSIRACARRQAAPVIRATEATELSLVFSAIGLLLAVRKPKDTAIKSTKRYTTFRYIAIGIGLLVLIGTFAFLLLIFYALSQI